jgi:hypothetical protein
MSNTNHDFLVKNGLVVGQAITSTGTLTQAGQTFPASDGSAGQYLKTNGSGALSWGTVSTSFNITDGTTTDTVGLTETVTFTGGTNISLAVTDNTVTITNDVVDSDDITEGSSNLFYTDARAIAAIQGASNLTIDGGTLYIDTAADRVGISDTSPQQKLDVAGNIGVNGSEVIDASGNIVGSVADSAMTVGGSLAGVLSNLKVQYGTSYSGTPIQGSFFFDSLNQKLKVYTGSAFIDAVPAGSGGGGGGGATDANTTFRNYSYTLTGTTSAVSGVDDNELTAGAFIIGHKYTITSVGNTDFTAIGASGNTVGVVFTATGVGSGTGQAKQTLFYDTTSSATRVVAYVNGIKQVYGSGRDFVATTGTSVAFTYNLGSGDTVDLQVYELLTNDAYYVKSEVYTQTEVNSQISTGVSSYLPLAGGTMTGGLTVQSSTGQLRLQGTSNTNKNVSIFYNESGDYGQINVDESGVNQKDLWITGLNLKFGRSTSAERMRIDSSGRVGIGTDNPTVPLHIVSSGTSIARFVGSNIGNLYVTNDSDNVMTLQASGSTALSFNTDGANERMRIDASGNLLLGKTAPTIATTGVELRPNGQVFATQSGNYPLLLNRTTSDGTIVQFRKDNTTSGNIGVEGSNLSIDGGLNKVGLQFRGAEIRPRDNGVAVDGTVDFGNASNRFKDLYLSGGVYLGGTGSANKLDDYEEGSFTVTSTRNGVGEDTGGWRGRYAKIGSVVHVTISTNTYVRHLGSGYGTNQQFIITSNLPFTPSSSGGSQVAHTRTLADPEKIALTWRANNAVIYLNQTGLNNSYTVGNNVVTASTQTNITLIWSGSFYTAD